MVQYNSANVKVYSSQHNEIKISNMISDSNDKTDFPSKLWLTERQFWRLSKTFQIIHQII